MEQLTEFANKSVLIVDDEEMNIFVTVKFLEKISDFQVFTAANGKQALELLEQNNIDIILTDINMPIMNGYEFAHAVRHDLAKPAIPIVALTGDDPVLEELHSAGMNGYLLKPFTREKLAQKLQDFLC